MEILFYNTNVVTHATHAHLPGIARFKKFFSIYPPSSVFIDRTGAIQTPIRTHSLFPIPALRPFTRSFEDICNDRARELLLRAEELDTKLHVFWSGGIDSTLVLVSLLKNATESQRSRLKVLLTRESIAENPRFYAEHLRGRIVCMSATMFPYILGTNALITGGDHNDQLFGSDVGAALIGRYGFPFLHERYDRDRLFAFFDASVNDVAVTNLCLDLLERIVDRSPVDITTNFQYLWWLNFSVKWQYVFIRMLAYTSPRTAAGITPEYPLRYFDQFYNTEEFQQWSMHNPDLRIKDTWSTYKWVCKDIIYEYTKDAEYRDQKNKRGSLSFLIQQQRSYNFIDTEYRLHNTMNSEEWYVRDNYFA